MKKIVSLALPLVAIGGCAMDVESTTRDLRVDHGQPGQSGVACPVDSDGWLAREWPVETVVAGDMEFERHELIAYVEKNPGPMSALVAEMAAVQLNLAAGLEAPDGVMEALVDADEWVMARPEREEEEVPPVVAVDISERLYSFNIGVQTNCFRGTLEESMAESPFQEDLRDNLVEEAPYNRWSGSSKDTRGTLESDDPRAVPGTPAL